MLLSPPLLSPILLTPGGAFGESRPARGGIHRGIDLRAEEGDPVVAASAGVVVAAKFDPAPPDGRGGGQFVIVRSIFDRVPYEIGYFHLADRFASVGSSVDVGELLGKAGETGTLRSGPHLHFQVLRVEGEGKRVPLDPWPILQASAAGVSVAPALAAPASPGSVSVGSGDVASPGPARLSSGGAVLVLGAALLLAVVLGGKR